MFIKSKFQSPWRTQSLLFLDITKSNLSNQFSVKFKNAASLEAVQQSAVRFVSGDYSRFSSVMAMRQARGQGGAMGANALPPPPPPRAEKVHLKRAKDELAKIKGTPKMSLFL